MRHLQLDVVDSTNSTALEQAIAGDPGNLWVSAQEQQRGKGSRGRQWVSMRGNFFASLMMKQNIQPRKLATMTFVASLAVFETLAQLVEQHTLQLKWPNDVLLNGAKISGILLESHVVNNQPVQIVGVGINLLHHPVNSNYPTTNLQTEGISTTPNEILSILSVQMERWLSIWSATNGFDEIRKQWLQRAKGLHQQIVVNLPNRRLTGIFMELDADGLLVLKTSGGKLKHISTADIFFDGSDNIIKSAST